MQWPWFYRASMPEQKTQGEFKGIEYVCNPWALPIPLFWMSLKMRTTHMSVRWYRRTNTNPAYDFAAYKPTGKKRRRSIASLPLYPFTPWSFYIPILIPGWIPKPMTLSNTWQKAEKKGISHVYDDVR